jgi:hypothetical protein
MLQAEPLRIFIHAGFHKTGTKSVQASLAHNREILGPHVRVVLKSDMPDVCDAALAFARRPNDVHLGKLAAEIRRWIATRDSTDERPIVVSAEDLCGRIPGRKGRLGYPSALPILRCMTAEIGSAIPAAAPHVFLSTRSAESWLESCHAHHIRHARSTMDRMEYAAANASGADLDSEASRIAAGLHGVPVTTSPLDQSSIAAHGPLTPLLDLLGVPDDLRAKIQPAGHANRALPRDIGTAFLALNRSTLSNAAVAAAKRALIAAHKKAQT